MYSILCEYHCMPKSIRKTPKTPKKYRENSEKVPLRGPSMTRSARFRKYEVLYEECMRRAREKKREERNRKKSREKERDKEREPSTDHTSKVTYAKLSDKKTSKNSSKKMSAKKSRKKRENLVNSVHIEHPIKDHGTESSHGSKPKVAKSRAKRVLNPYQEFVRKESKKRVYKTMSATDRMKAIGKAWKKEQKEQNNNTSTGADNDSYT